MADVVVTRAILDIDQGLPLALWLSLLCQGGVCSLVFGVGPPNLFLICVSDMQCEVGGVGAFNWERSLSIHLLELFICECTLSCHL